MNSHSTAPTPESPLVVSSTLSTALSRRHFAKSLAMAGAAAWSAGLGASGLRGQGVAAAPTSPASPRLPPTPAVPDEAFWRTVRAQFPMAAGVSVMNAANLCPSSWQVLRVLEEQTRAMDGDPSFENRKPLAAGKEATRGLLAGFLGAAPEEIVITRNTSEANNMVSLGLDLRRGDEVVLFGDNHPCNKAAWEARRERHGFTLVEIPIVTPHPGMAHYVDAVRAVLTPRTRLVAFTHHTNTMGDLFPAREICALARERGVLTLIDGAQSFGLLDFSLAELQPDFYSGSAHKWLCGPKEVGVLYVNRRSQALLWPSVVSSGNGAVGISKTHEAFGQRDEPAIIACGEAVKLQQQIGRRAIEARARELGQRLMAGLRRLDGVKLWTNPDPALSVSVVVFQPGSLNPAEVAAALYRDERIGCTARMGDRPGLRISPHFYNLPDEVDRAVAAVGTYLARGRAT